MLSRFHFMVFAGCIGLTSAVISCSEEKSTSGDGAVEVNSSAELPSAAAAQGDTADSLPPPKIVTSLAAESHGFEDNGVFPWSANDLALLRNSPPRVAFTGTDFLISCQSETPESHLSEVWSQKHLLSLFDGRSTLRLQKWDLKSPETLVAQ
jgi:hypothetical protein